MFGQTAITGHRLIHFDADWLKYEGLTRMLLKIQTASLMNGEKINFVVSESVKSEF